MAKGKLILITTLICTLIGITTFLTKPKHKIYRVQLEHLEGEDNEFSKFWFQDEVIILPATNYVARVYSNYNLESVKNPTNKITEVKIYIPESINSSNVLEEFNDYLKDKPIKVLSYKKQGELREWNIILGWIIFGIFLAITVDFIISFKRNSEKHKQE